MYKEMGGPQVWCGRGAENLTTTRIRSPDRPAHNESLSRLHHPGPQKLILRFKRKIKEKSVKKKKERRRRVSKESNKKGNK
jgi:hypothetical protein